MIGYVKSIPIYSGKRLIEHNITAMLLFKKIDDDVYFFLEEYLTFYTRKNYSLRFLTMSKSSMHTVEKLQEFVLGLDVESDMSDADIVYRITVGNIENVYTIDPDSLKLCGYLEEVFRLHHLEERDSKEEYAAKPIHIPYKDISQKSLEKSLILIQHYAERCKIDGINPSSFLYEQHDYAIKRPLVSYELEKCVCEFDYEFVSDLTEDNLAELLIWFDYLQFHHGVALCEATLALRLQNHSVTQLCETFGIEESVFLEEEKSFLEETNKWKINN